MSRTSCFGVRPGLLWAILAVVFVAAPFVRGGEDDVYAQVLRRYEEVNSELNQVIMEMDCPAPLPDYSQRMLSLRKNASVTIGGEMRVNYIGSWSTFTQPDPGDRIDGSRLRHNTKTGSLGITSANVDIDIRAGKRWRAYFDINMNGYHGFNRVDRVTNPNSPGAAATVEYDRERTSDFLDAAYIELMKDGHSGLGFRAGIMSLPFGLGARPNLIGKSFMDAPDLTGSYLVNPMAWDNAVRLPHASRFIDPALAAMITYELRDIIRFEGAVFQDTEGQRNYERGSQYRSRRTDSPLPRSWQVGMSFLPLEGWELSTHFRNRYSRSRGVHYWADSPYRWDFRNNMAYGGTHDPTWDAAAGQWSDSGGGAGFGSRSNEQSFILGLAVEIPNTKWSVQAEYAHGWNQGFNKYINSDGVNLGLSYRLSPFLTLHAQGEWLHVKDRSWMADTGGGVWVRDTRNNRLYRALFGAEYELLRGLTLEAGWQYEYWCLSSAMGGAGGTNDRRVNTSNMVYAGTRFIF